MARGCCLRAAALPVQAERSSVGNMRKNTFLLFIIFGSTALLPASVFAQGPAAPTSAPLREVRKQTIVSKELPAAELTFGRSFRYVGGQRVNLYGNAEAEQHLFVKSGDSGVLAAFYWVQFERFFPTNALTYDYKADRTTQIGDLQFIYDAKSWPDYAAMQSEDPASDGAAIARLLGDHNLAFPKKAARVRMFHLPSADRRTELMIIYGEALPEGSKIPVGTKGSELDTDSPESARQILERARRDLSIRTR